MLLLLSCQVVFDSLRPHELQHARLPSPSPSPRVCPSSCPFQWCHPTISSSFAFFSFCINMYEHIRSPVLNTLNLRWQDSESESCSVVSTSFRSHRLYHPWNSPGQNTGVGSQFPSPGDLPNPGTEPRSSALQVDSLPAEPPGKPDNQIEVILGNWLQEPTTLGFGQKSDWG